MIPATSPVQRPPGAKLLVVDAAGELQHTDRVDIVDYLRPGDLVVANDAETIPGSLYGIHEASGAEIEIRLAGRDSLALDDVGEVIAVAFGRGDHRTPTEERPLPPELLADDRLLLGPLRATVLRPLGHPRLLALAFAGRPEEIWAWIARHGRPIQYVHVEERLALWDVWTRIASLPVSFEPPSAGFLLDWQLLGKLQKRGVRFATLTHAAGLSSTGDPVLDRRLPLDEPYRIPGNTVRAIRRTVAEGGRVIALGTTVTRALEHVASRGRLTVGAGVADQRIGPGTELRVVDAIVTGVHEPGDSHYELLRAFAGDAVLQRISTALDDHGYRTHEFGDSVLLERQRPAWSAAPLPRGEEHRRSLNARAAGESPGLGLGHCASRCQGLLRMSQLDTWNTTILRKGTLRDAATVCDRGV